PKRRLGHLALQPRQDNEASSLTGTRALFGMKSFPVQTGLGRQPDIPPPSLPIHLALQFSPAFHTARRQLASLDSGQNRTARFGSVGTVAETAVRGQFVDIAE